MRTNIDIDDTVLDAAMKAGPYKTKKDAVEAGLKLLARQAHYREVLRWEGKLQWDADTEARDSATAPPASEPAVPLSTGSTGSAAASSVLQAHEPSRKRRDAGR